MKKKYLLIILLLLFIEFFNLANFAKAFYSRLNFLETDKETYYINDEIKINASWELFYNTNTEIAYVQIQIFNHFNKIIWNSSEYNEIGSFEEIWILNLEHLNISLSNYSNILQIKFFSYYFHIDSTNTAFNFLETIETKIIKRELSCELAGFKDHLKFGENLKFVARFYDNSLESVLNLVNQTISFKIDSNNLTLYQYNHTLNETGMTSIFISSFTHLNLGPNYLIFTLVNSKIYNDSKFVYEIIIEKNPIFINILRFKDNLTKSEDLEITLFYYYYLNDTLKPLNNQSIELKIFENQSLIFVNEYRTDELGVLTINLTSAFFDSNQKSKDLVVNFNFSGTYFFENKTIYLRLKITELLNSKSQNSLEINILQISIVLVVISIVLSFVIIKKKHKNETPLSELVIRY